MDYCLNSVFVTMMLRLIEKYERCQALAQARRPQKFPHLQTLVSSSSFQFNYCKPPRIHSRTARLTNAQMMKAQRV
jgi:hypothetical protein